MENVAQRGLAASLLLASALAAMEPAVAWSSKEYPLFEPVHQKAIAQVLAAQLPADAIALLQQQQAEVDQDQAPSQSAEHSMTGIEKAGLNEATERVAYIAKAEQWVGDNLQRAIERRKAGATADAMQALGRAIHAMTDATSPAHHGFQAWSFDESWIAVARHVTQERVYPVDQGNQRYARRLEAAVRWAYDIYLQRTPMPTRFFDAAGELCLPDDCKAR
jgi:hypothetical protein